MIWTIGWQAYGSPWMRIARAEQKCSASPLNTVVIGVTGQEMS